MIEGLEAAAKQDNIDFKALIVDIDRILALRGGRGSGNWGHVGRKGKRGGSGKGGGLKRIGAKPGSSVKDRKKASRKLAAKRKKEAQAKGKGKSSSIPKGEKPSSSKTDIDQKGKNWFFSQKEPAFDNPRTSLGGYTITNTRDVSEKAINDISKDSGLSKDRVKDFIRDWGKSPDETGKIDHQRLQQSASKKFGVNPPERQKLNHNATSESDNFLDSAYKNTQDKLKQSGIKSLTLYRGMSNAKSGSYDGNVLDSWTLDPKVAQRFADVSKGENKGVIKMSIPVERIVSTPFTGLGTIGDFEFVVLAGDNAGQAILTDE